MVTMVIPSLSSVVDAVVYDPESPFETKKIISPGVESDACWQLIDQSVSRNYLQPKGVTLLRVMHPSPKQPISNDWCMWYPKVNILLSI